MHVLRWSPTNRLVWTVVILDSIEAQNVQLGGAYKIVWRPKAGFERTPSNPPLPTGLLVFATQCVHGVKVLWGTSQNV